MMFIFYCLLVVLMLAGVISTILGAFVLIQFGLMLKAPADKSNRINRIRLFWFALTRPEIFVPFFEWLKRDEYDNVK